MRLGLPDRGHSSGRGGATLEIQDALCTGCGMCASACPEKVLAIQPLAPVRRYGSG
ncbi:4Fe-4S dicluster domain-containing protein [Phaeobacter sp. B1627]|uniref:4Fe-4S dicluster domain-containing protein n=1 Tax=Phaeobacter sp. B1627 TaxID=2583809 RepID=UPI0021034561|nr:4Fe-4S dicluster domain-containing protein [Phaeobacter sp. B1627]